MKSRKNKYLWNLFLILFLNSCSVKQQDTLPIYENKRIVVSCTYGEKVKTYELGDLICTKSKININKHEYLEIKFIVNDKNSEDPYEYGYQELHRYRNGRLIEKVKLREDSDAYWSQTPFIRLREKLFLSDLDGNGTLEFAILPFHPGSAIWLTARIYSLDSNQISYWGNGRYRFEADTHVQLNCPKCSKFNSAECKKCH